MKRESTQTIWRTVVFAGAMLGTPACGKGKPAATTPPANAASETTKPEAATATPTTPATPATDPCAGQDRPRGTDDDGGGGEGRGFVLS
ncbi:MAG: hypothetical protein JWO36_3978 [Myxococcales bacterium]|nr:hypothetical protein [Myxococcales bacterium]